MSTMADLMAQEDAKMKASGFDPRSPDQKQPPADPRPTFKKGDKPAAPVVKAPEPKVEEPEVKAPAPAAQDLDAFLDSALDGKPAATKAPEPAPSDKDNNLAFLRKSAEEARAEAKRLAEEKAALAADLEKHRAELAKIDVAYDPEFQRLFEKPMDAIREKARQIGEYSGLKPEHIEKVLREGLDLPRPQLKEMLKGMDADADTVSNFAQLAMEKAMLVKSRAAALQNHEQTAAQIKQQRVAAQAQQLGQLGEIRNQAMRLGVKAAMAEDQTGFLKPSAAEDQAALAADIRRLPSVLDPAPGEDSAKHYARQVGVITKGLAFDRVAQRAVAAEQELAALKADLAKRGWSLQTVAVADGKAKVVPVNDRQRFAEEDPNAAFAAMVAGSAQKRLSGG